MTRPTTETEVLILTPGQYSASLAFRRATALESCTETDSDDQGRLLIVRKPYAFSSGEERLWLVLQWLNGCAQYPDLVDLKANLDVDNYAAVMDVIA